MISCADWRLYVILDRASLGTRDIIQVAEAVIRGGADAIQLRDKTATGRQLLQDAQALCARTRQAGVPFILNDRVDVAAAAGADGVHLGQDDLPLRDARRLLGPKALVGISTHSLEQALKAEAEGADYLGFGPVFPTPTKPEYASVGLEHVAQIARLRVPAVCIGGIDHRNVEQVLRAGAERIAVVRAVCNAPDPEAATRELKRAIAQFAPTTSSPHL